MCSVSFLPHSRGFCVGMNRDESLRRATANPPQIFIRAGRAALYPTEPEGGTWIAVNDAGLGFALLNWNRPGSGASPAPTVSRGAVIPALLIAQTFAEMRAALAGLTLDFVAPFRLLVFASRERIAREFRWDCERLGEQSHGWAPRHWFSSGFDEPAAQRERGRVCRAAWRQPRAGGLPWLRRLHAAHAPARGPFSLCMHRRDAATVSYTEAVVTRRAATLRHHAGPLCTHPIPTSIHTMLLSRKRKESAPRPTNQATTPPMKTTHSRFNRLVALYYPAVYRLAAKFSASPVEAAALTRRTFERAARQLPRFRAPDEIQFLLLAALTRAATPNAA